MNKKQSLLLFTFGSRTFTAQQGETWASWLKENGGDRYELVCEKTGNVTWSDFYVTYEDGTIVKGTDEIREGYTYKKGGLIEGLE